MKRSILTIVFIFFCSANFSYAIDGKFSAYTFGDLFWFARHENAKSQNVSGLWFRRIYFTYDVDIVTDFSARLRFELGSPDHLATSAILNPFLKDAYLKWKPGQHAVFVGLSPTPTWEFIESHWGYRSVEKTPLDLAKFGGSRDLAVAVKGTFGSDQMFGYHAMIGNGSDTKSEVDKEKKAYLSFSVKPISDLVVEAYGDYETGEGQKDKYTLQGFAGLKSDWGRIGTLFAYRVLRQGTGKGDVSLRLLSLYGALKITEQLWFYTRADRMFNPNPSGEAITYIKFNKSFSSYFALAGVDYEPAKKVHIMPNVEAVLYAGAGAPVPVVVPRLTFFYEF